MNTPDFTVPHQEDLSALKSSKRKDSSPPPHCKRLKLLKNPLKERKHDPMPSSSKEPNSCKANFSTYDFKCSKFCFKKCQCDIRLSQDFAPVAGSSSQELTEPDPSQCQVVSHSDSGGLSISIDNGNNCENAKNTTFEELDLFDEAVALSGSVPLSGIGVSVFCNETDGDTQCVVDQDRESSEAENLYGDLDIDDNSSKSADKMNVKCTDIHKHNLKCRAHAGLIRHRRGLEGLAIVSTGAMSLTSHLVDIMPHWNKLRKFAVIHTGRFKFDQAFHQNFTQA